MIVSAILTSIFQLLKFAFNLLPDLAVSNETFDLTTLLLFISKAFVVFPSDVFFICVANITAWKAIQLTWAIIEWVYKKIPGVS